MDTQNLNKRVLCVEDEHFINELYMRALTRAGYQVDITLDGAKGYDMAKSNQYDFILLDIMLPNMMGTEILKRLKSEVRDLKAKIIITTNLDQQKDVRAAIEKDADGYIIKAEVTPRQLVDFLSKMTA